MSSNVIYDSKIVAVQFNVSGSEDVVRESAVPITTYDLFKNNKPFPKGVYDGHLGTTDHTHRCDTCFNNKKYCTGHDGHYNLNYPVLSPLFMGSDLMKWLRLICFRCGNPIIDISMYQQYPKDRRLTEASKAAKYGNKKCQICQEPHPNVVKDKDKPLMITSNIKNEETKLYPHMISTILTRISDSTVEKLGKDIKSHPRKFVLFHIKVTPTTLRPDQKRSAGRSSNNELTTLTQNVFRKNEKLPTYLPDEIDANLEESIYALQEAYYGLVRGSTGKRVMSGGGNTPMNSMAARLRGKEGLHRKHQQGKRVRVVGRTTIVGDPSLGIGQVSIPVKFARTLQVEEIVQEYNKKKLTVFFLNGRQKYPGCSKIIRKDSGVAYTVEDPHAIPEPQIGDIIYRDLINGDVLLYNRQPSLLPSSISGMEVVVTMDPEILTFGMNVISCPFFNADFDGDQMNIYVGSSLSSRIEIERLSGVQNWFIKHAFSSPMIGQADDSIIGTFLLTRHSVKFTKPWAMLIFSSSKKLPDFTSNEYSGRDLMSMCLEDTPINFQRAPTYYKKELAGLIDYDSKDTHVVIERGKHVRGVLDKKSIGKGSIGGIFHLISTKYGEKKALDVIYDMQQLALQYMHQTGFTIGINDFLISKESLTKIHEIESEIIDKSRMITERLNNGKIIPPVGKTVKQFYEEQQIAILRIMDDFAGPMFESADPSTNNLLKLVFSGSKGSINHVYHISSAIGQIVINDKRPKEQFAYARTMPQFPRFCTNPVARGMIMNSYIAGMSPVGCAFNAMNARFDFITKALYTSVTGDSERKSMKNLESININNMRLCVKYNNVIQFLYGEDGLDTRYVIKVRFPTVSISDKELEDGWKYSPSDAKFKNLFEKEYKQVVDDRAEFRRIFLKLEKGKFNEPMSDSKFVSVDIERLVSDSIYAYGEKKPTDEELAVMVNMVDNLCTVIPYIMINEIQEKLRSAIPEYIQEANWGLCVYIRSVLNSQHSLKKLDKIMLEDIIGQIRIKQARALCSYGTAVGVIAAMSFSEPLTQYMLDAHHRTTEGGTSKSAMTTVQEVLGAKKTEKLAAPTMILVPLPKFDSESALNTIANQVEVMKLGSFVRLSQISYEKFGEPVTDQYKHEADSLIKPFIQQNPLLKVPGDLLKWCIRMVLNKTTMIFKNMTLENIVTKLRDVYPELYIVYSSENAKEVIIRVYIRNTFFKAHVEQEAIEDLLDTLHNTIIRGVDKILSAKVTKLMRHEVSDDGSLQRTQNKFCIQTLGTNMADMFKVAAIDPYQIQTDAIDEIQKVLGIEAARQKLFTSIRNLGAGGLNMHHVSIYVDEMTYLGYVTSVEKQGLSKREKNNILLRMGFSSPVQSLEDAAVNAMKDPVQGITSPLLIGDVPRSIGTAYNSFHINENMVKRNTVRPDDWLDAIGL